MIKRIFSSQSKSITGAALVLAVASFISRIIGIVRDRIFAHQFGAGDILDTYFAAFRIPDLVYNLIIVGALSAGFIPIFMKLLVKDQEEAWRVTSAIFNILALALVIVCSILFFFTPQLMELVVPGFDPEKLKMTIILTRIMYLSPVLLGISGIVSGVLQSFKNFLVYALTPIMYNLGIIIGAIFLVPKFGISGLAYGVVLGALLHLVIQLPSLVYHGFRYKPLLLWKDKNVRKIGKLMIPRTLGLATSQINLLVITILASTLTAGSIAIFNLASNLQYFPIGIIGISFAIAAFPTLAKFAAEDKKEEIINQLSSTIKQILFFIIPLSIIFLLLRAQIVRVVLGSGQFNWGDTDLTANTLAFFSLSLFAQCLIPLLARTFYAIHDTWTPFLVGLVAALANILAAMYLKNVMGVSGLALAFSLAMILQMSLLWIGLRTSLGTLGESKIIISLYKISAAALAMALVIQVLKQPLSMMVDMTRFWGILSQGAISGTIGLLVYGLILHFLQLEEMKRLNRSLKKKWLKLANVQGEINRGDEI